AWSLQRKDSRLSAACFLSAGVISDISVRTPTRQPRTHTTRTTNGRKRSAPAQRRKLLDRANVMSCSRRKSREQARLPNSSFEKQKVDNQTRRPSRRTRSPENCLRTARHCLKVAA